MERRAKELRWLAQGKTKDDDTDLLGISFQNIKKEHLASLGNHSSAAIRALEFLSASV
jgi:hypothetical protein